MTEQNCTYVTKEIGKHIEQIPFIRNHAFQLHRLAKEIATCRSGSYKENDFLGAMTDAFMHKQMAHLKSICILVEANQSPDALIIARSSYESMALLLWAAHSPPRINRPRQWFLYEIKERYCEWIKGKYKDLDLSPEVKKSLTQNVQDYADILLTGKGRKKLLRDKPLEVNDFIIRKLPQFQQILEDESLDGKIDRNAYALYKLLSKWPHGAPQGIGMVFQHDGKCLSPDGITCKYLGGCALHLGVISLGTTAILFNDHFKLGFDDRLTELGKRYSDL